MPGLKPGWILIIMSDVVFFTAPVVFVIVALNSGMTLSDTVDAMMNQYRAERSNLLVTSLLALFPMLLLALVLWIGRRFGKFETTAGAAALGGSIGVLIVIAFVNFQHWPTFLPELRYAGWPHGLELFLGPVIAAPAVMLFGMAIGVLASK